MTTTGRVKVRMTVTVEVDPEEWVEEYGCERSEVRQDVRDYFTDVMAQSVAGSTLAVRVA